jgi:carbonic anhydrase/acetyltransferase-like protein (isoleucine patch superfamily)
MHIKVIETIVEFRKKVPKIHDTAFIARNSTSIGDVTISKRYWVFYGVVCRADFNRIFVGPRSCVQENAVLNPMTEPIVLEGGNIIGYSSVLHGGEIVKGV